MAPLAVHKRFWANALLLLIGVFLVFQAAHSFQWHPDHSDALPCSERHDGKGAHLHDTRYCGENCSLCAFCLRACPVPPFPQLQVPLGIIADLEVFPPCSPCVKTACDSTLRRGPPAI